MARNLAHISGATGVVHQDRHAARHNIVRVELLDGEVPAVGGAGGGVDAEDGGVGVGGGVEGIAGLEFAGGDPGVGGVVPELRAPSRSNPEE
jgi:hypothetical protein